MSALPHLPGLRRLRSKSTNAKALAKLLQMLRVDRPSRESLWTGPGGRRKWFKYWLWEMPLEGLQWILFQILRVAPITGASNFGGLCSRVIVPILHRDAIKRTMTNLRWLEPSWDEVRLKEATTRHFESIGRLRAEFALLHRLLPAGRIKVENVERMLELVAAGPVIIVGTHVGNWETIGLVSQSYGIPICFVFEPQPSAMQTRLALQVRFECLAEGSVGFPRGTGSLITAVRWLKEGKVMALFCDEPVSWVSAAPFFGRRPHTRSNFAFATRLARMTGASLLPFHVIRHPGCRFTVCFDPQIVLAPERKGRHNQLLHDVNRINAAIEPTIRKNIDQWYWLDWFFADVTYPPSRT